MDTQSEIFTTEGRYAGYRSSNAKWVAAEDLTKGAQVVLTGTTNGGKYWQGTFTFSHFSGEGNGLATMWSDEGQSLGMWERTELVAVRVA